MALLATLVLVACAPDGRRTEPACEDCLPDPGDRGEPDAGTEQHVDAGDVVDAGETADAGDAPDAAGEILDGGDIVDAGDPIDAGSDAGTCLGAPGDTVGQVEIDGRTRTWRIHVPSGYDCTRPTPVVFNFHGTTKDAAYQVEHTRMLAKADEAGFIAVHPEGYRGLGTRAWNIGGNCCGDPGLLGLDDVALVRTIVARLAEQVHIDERRIYATGHSSGGALSYRLACEAADLFAAIAPVGAPLGLDACTPSRPVPMLHFHGTWDQVVPMAGSLVWGWDPVMSQVEEWAVRNGCKATRSTTTFQHGDSTCTAFDDCPAGAEVALCLTEGGGHTWPGGVPDPLLGYTTTDLSATDALWEFFAAHPR